MGHGHLQTERGAQDQAGPGSRDRAQDVSGPHHQVQGGLHHVGHGAGPVAHRHHGHRRWRRPGTSQQSRGASAHDKKDVDLFMASGAAGAGAVYTDSGEAIHILRKILIRVSAKLDWLILKLH